MALLRVCRVLLAFPTRHPVEFALVSRSLVELALRVSR